MGVNTALSTFAPHSTWCKEVRNIVFLIDADNFYFGAEAVFDASLREKAVVVLSGNDACVVARSPLAKQLGVRMGAPIFEYRELIATHNIILRSSNYALYSSLSDRMVKAIELFFPREKIERYSIDEVFVNGSAIPDEELLVVGRKLRTTVQRLTGGLSVSIGIASTKILAKVSIEIAKAEPEYRGVHSLALATEQEIDTLLAGLSVKDIWGIGTRTARKLEHYHGIISAKALKYADPRWIRTHIHVVGQRIVLELNGRSCLPVQATEKPKKSILSSQTFGHAIVSLESVKQAVAYFMSKAAEKLRKQGSRAALVAVFLQTNRFAHDEPYYAQSASKLLPFPSAFTPDLITVAQELVAIIYRSGYSFKRAGVYLARLSPQAVLQGDLFGDFSLEQQAKQERLMHMVDALNRYWGNNTLFYASIGIERTWQMKQTHKSPSYTTRWQDILTIQ